MLILLLIVVSALLLVVELVLLPGITVAGLMSMAADCAAAYLAYLYHGYTGLIAAVIGIIVCSVIATTLSLRRRTWRMLSLESEIDGQSQSSPQDELRVGQRGTSVSRLAPGGKVRFGDTLFEARAREGLIAPGVEVEVTGFDNFTVIVKPTDNTQL